MKFFFTKSSRGPDSTS